MDDGWSDSEARKPCWSVSGAGDDTHAQMRDHQSDERERRSFRLRQMLCRRILITQVTLSVRPGWQDAIFEQLRPDES